MKNIYELMISLLPHVILSSINDENNSFMTSYFSIQKLHCIILIIHEIIEDF
jgi:hypothetical protein